MSIEIKVPPLPESVADATLVAWHKKAGDSVSRDANLVDLETDKVVLEVPAPANGKLIEILIEEGATVTAGDVLAILEEGAAEAAPVESSDSGKEEPAQAAVEAPAASVASGKSGKTSPAVRRLLEEHDLDATMVMGSGKDGRITKSDVMDFLKADESSDVTTADTSTGVETSVAEVALERTEQRVPMTRLRARIAERLLDHVQRG